MTKHCLAWLIAIALALVATGCGGGDGQSGETLPYSGPSIGTGELKENAHVLDENAAKDSVITADTLTVKKPQEKTYKPGDVLIVDAHNGRLIKIVSVAETAGPLHSPIIMAEARGYFA